MDKNLELRRLYTQSFDDSEAFVDYFFRKLTSPDKVVALIRDGKTVSALHLLDRRIFLRGELFEMPFVVAAATVRELRGMRLLETVMRSAFERLYSEGKTFVALYPFSHAYYRKYGFVTYTKISRKEIKYKKDGETERNIFNDDIIVSQVDSYPESPICFAVYQFFIVGGNHTEITERRNGNPESFFNIGQEKSSRQRRRQFLISS